MNRSSGFAVLVAAVALGTAPALAQGCGGGIIHTVNDWNTNAFAVHPPANTKAFAGHGQANTKAFAPTSPAGTGGFGQPGGTHTGFRNNSGQAVNAFGNHTTASNNVSTMANAFGTNTDHNVSPVMPHNKVQPGNGPLSGK